MSSDRRAARRERRRERRAGAQLADVPFRQLRNPWSPVDVLTTEQVERIHDASMRILEQMGVLFMNDEALDILEVAGADVDRSNQLVKMDGGLVMEAVEQAPSAFTLHARNPQYNLWIGDNYINFAPVASAPYILDPDKGRRNTIMADLDNYIRLSHICNALHIGGGQQVEPMDVPAPVRHLERTLSSLLLSDKVFWPSALSREIAQDAVEMAALVFGGKEVLLKKPVLFSVINASSPRRFDGPMLDGLITFARAGQVLVITPFILAGAMSPITMAAALAQQNAEALAGIAFTQLVNPGGPVIYGGFTTNIDMKSGSPAFGTPEGAWAGFAGAQLARFYNLPYRGNGGLTSALTPDAQAAYETMMHLWPAVLGHSNLVAHSAGWLENGLLTSYEKFVIDVELLNMMSHFLQGIEINDETLALDSIAMVPPGSHHLGTEHTIARYMTEFYTPLISTRDNYQSWEAQGAPDILQRAHTVWQTLLAQYEQPPIDPGVAEALRDYVARRERELIGESLEKHNTA